MSGARLESVETLYEGWGRLLKVTASLPDGSTVSREVEDHGHAAGILAYDPDRRVATLVRQLRAPILLAEGAPETLEVIAGLLDGDAPDVCARREADEEAGLRLSTVDPVVVLHTMPGISTECIHLFLATYGEADKVGSGGGLAVEAENITVVEMRLDALAALADRGEVRDAKTLVLLQTLRLRRPELFAP